MSEKLTAEQVRDAIFNGSSYASFDGAKYYADGIHMQEIADELNTTLGGECTPHGEWGAVPATEENMAAHGWVRERTCEFVIEDNMNETEGMGDVWFRCTNCDTAFDYYADNWLMNENFCPRCGAKVRKAVER